jgi:hypothetical protein
MPPLTLLAKGDRPYEGLRSLDLLRGSGGWAPRKEKVIRRTSEACANHGRVTMLTSVNMCVMLEVVLFDEV